MRRININQNQLAIPFREVRSRAISYEDRQRVFWSMVTISLLSLTAYVYAVNATAHHLAVRQNMEKEVAQAAADLGELEFAHIELSNAVTIETAREYGFQEVRQPLYVTRSGPGSLTLNTVKR